MKNLSKLLPSVCVILFVVFLAVLQISDWSFITVLPYLLLGISLTVTSFGISISTGSSTKWITWGLLLFSLLIHILLLAGIVEMRSVWKILVLAGIFSIFTYLFELTKRSGIFGKNTVKIAAIPTLTGILFSLVFAFTDRFLGFAFLALIIGVLLTIIGLLFGFRKSVR